jgi:hypothetical protein
LQLRQTSTAAKVEAVAEAVTVAAAALAFAVTAADAEYKVASGCRKSPRPLRVRRECEVRVAISG